VTRIVVVDDEVALVELVRGYLEREQYEVLTASDGRTALDLARTAQPDLVVLDVMLPELDGIGLTIAQSLARAMSGDIRVASAGLGQGSSFTLTLPLVHE
jgi:DNA-binding response OmpR family regulator